MSTSDETYRARHAAPHGSMLRGAAARRVAFAAAAVAAGAVPLAGAGAAQAATGPLGDLGGVLPAGIAHSVDLHSVDLHSVELPTIDAPLAVGNAVVPLDQAVPALAPARAVTEGAQQLTGRLTSVLPVNNLMPALLPADGKPLQVAPNLLQDGALGALSQGLEPQTQDLAGAVVVQTAPLVGRLHQAGVPTVGDLTGQVSKAALPGVGAVGGLTQSLPVTSVLGPNSPVTGALDNLSRL